MANILVVDDEPDIRSIVEQVLRDAGYGVASAANGAEALNRLREQRPDGIILDLNMPVMDGKAFLSACRAEPAYANLPVALFTTSVGVDGLVETMDVQACIAKPFDLDGVTEAITRLVPQPVAAHAWAIEPMRSRLLSLQSQIQATRSAIERGHHRIAVCNARLDAALQAMERSRQLGSLG